MKGTQNTQSIIQYKEKPFSTKYINLYTYEYRNKKKGIKVTENVLLIHLNLTQEEEIPNLFSSSYTSREGRRKKKKRKKVKQQNFGEGRKKKVSQYQKPRVPEENHDWNQNKKNVETFLVCERSYNLQQKPLKCVISFRALFKRDSDLLLLFVKREREEEIFR